MHIATSWRARMTTNRLFPTRLRSILALIIVSIQLTACGFEDVLSTISPEVGSNTSSTTSSIATTEKNSTNEAAKAANITLSWSAPAEREDNTPISLSEVNGYKIYYGTTQGQYPSSVTINDGTAVDYIFQDFNPATYYFVVTTFDTNGLESNYSSEVQVSI